MVITNKQLVVGAVSIIVLAGVSFGGFKGYSAWQDNKEYIATLTANVQEQTTLANETAVTLSATQTELSAIKEQFGVAQSDKEKAETEAATQKSAAQTQKSAATAAKADLAVCASNYDALLSAGAAVEQQRNYYADASKFMTEAAVAIVEEDFYTANQYMDYAIENAEAAKALDATVS